MTNHTFTMSEEQAERVHKLVRDQIASLHNWTASAIEQGKMDRAKELVEEIRSHQALFAAFNMTSKREVSDFTGEPIRTHHQVRDSK